MLDFLKRMFATPPSKKPDLSVLTANLDNAVTRKDLKAARKAASRMHVYDYYSESLWAYQKIIEVWPEQKGEIFSEIASVYTDMKQYDDAILYYERAIVNGGEKEYIYVDIADVYEQMNRYDDAILYYEKAREYGADSWTIDTNIEECLTIKQEMSQQHSASE